MVFLRHNTSTNEKVKTGTMYVQCILDKMKKGPVTAFVTAVAGEVDEVVSRETGTLFSTMHTMVRNGEKMHLPESRYNGTDRTIVRTHPKEMTFALRGSINKIRASGVCAVTMMLPVGFFGRIAAYKHLVQELKRRAADVARANGTEADQRREHVLDALEEIQLYHSILSASVAADQFAARKEAIATGTPKPRDSLDTLTLGVAVSCYHAIGQRGMNLDDALHGYLALDTFKGSHSPWEDVTPRFLTMKSGAKGDDIDGTKHLFEILHHRDPMKCPIAMLGLYFAYQFLGLQESLPCLDTWLTEMHQRPLLRKQSGYAQRAEVKNLTEFLKQEIRLIDADEGVSFHSIRHGRICKMGEDHAMDRTNIMHGASHATGSHATNYRSTNAPWILMGAGYRGSDPEILAAHVRALYEYAFDDPDKGDAIVNALYMARRPEIITLERQAAEDQTRAGESMREWLAVMRHCILTFVVSCCAHPRDRSNYIDQQQCTKYQLMAPEFQILLAPLMGKPVYDDLQECVRAFQALEIEMGELAHCGATERRTRAQTIASEANTRAHLQEMANQVKEHVTNVVAAPLNDQAELNKDRDYYMSFNEETKNDRFRKDPVTKSAVGTQELHDDRLRAEQRRREEHAELLRTGGPMARYPQLLKGPLKPPTCAACLATPPLGGVCPHTHVPHTRALKDGATTNAAPVAVSTDKDDEPAVDSKRVRELEQRLAKFQDQETGDPPDFQHKPRDVSQVIQRYLSHILPKERHGTTWRSEATRGKEKATKLTQLITRKYEPVVLQVVYMYQSLAGIPGREISLRAAAQHLERQRAGQEWTKWIDTLKMCREIKAQVKGTILKDGFWDAWIDEGSVATSVAASPGPSAAGSSKAHAADVGDARDADGDASKEMSTECYLGLDPGKSCGWAVLTVKDDVPVSLHVGVNDVGMMNPGNPMRGLVVGLKNLLGAMPQRPKHVFIEPYFFNPNHPQGAAIAFEMRGAIKGFMATFCLSYTDLPSQTWKKTITDSGTADKKAVIRALETKHEFKFPPKIPVLFPAYHDTVNLCDDASDAAGIVICGWLASMKLKHKQLDVASYYESLRAPLQINPTVWRKNKEDVVRDEAVPAGKRRKLA